MARASRALSRFHADAAAVRVLALLAFVLWAIGNASAHEVRPGFLRIEAQPTDAFTARLRQPILAIDEGGMGGLDLKVRFPAWCVQDEPSVYDRADGYLSERLSVRCPEGLGDEAISIDGLRGSITDIYVTYISASGRSENDLLNAQRPYFRPGARSGVNVAGYLRMGVEHLLGGLDHVLFVLGLILLVSNFRRLLLVATAFTLAHSVTLALAALDIVRLPSAPVEAAIALSIVFLAFELSRRSTEPPSLGRRRPELVALGFGLLHGFGFASVLGAAGLPSDRVAPALFLFNAGVEIGQMLVILCVCASLMLARRFGSRMEARYRAALTWTLGIGATYFLLGALFNLVG